MAFQQYCTLTLAVVIQIHYGNQCNRSLNEMFKLIAPMRPIRALLLQPYYSYASKNPIDTDALGFALLLIEIITSCTVT